MKSTCSEMTAPVVVGFGANLGPVGQTFCSALDILRLSAKVVAVSELYQTSPIGPEQPDFMNAAVLMQYPGELEKLLGELQAIELEFGRTRLEHWGPRTLDLDILWAGDRACSSFTLTVPHKELEHRFFALRPLLDLVPDARNPLDGVAYQTIVEAVEGQRLLKISSLEWSRSFCG